MSDGRMVKQENDDGVISPSISLDASSIIVNGLSDQAFLYPMVTQGCMTSSVPVYCTSCTQSSLILSPDTLRPSLITSPLPQDVVVMTPGVVGQVQTTQLSNNNLIKCEIPPVPTKDVVSPQVYDCRWLNCDERFVQLDDLVNHVNDHHVKVERPDIDYQCKWTGCQRQGRGFNARYKMLIHIRTHTNEKPHKCTRCGKCFSRLENLKIHNRSHTGEKPYTCPFPGCNKAYSNSSDRFKHVRTHQDQKPYICKMPGCNKRYTDPSSLRKHVRTHGHNVKGDNPSLQDAFCSEKGAELYLSTAVPYGVINTNKSARNESSKEITVQQIVLPSSPPATYYNPKIFSMQDTTSKQVAASNQVSELLPETMTNIPSHPDGNGSLTESSCQDGPLDLSHSSPTPTGVALAAFSTQMMAD